MHVNTHYNDYLLTQHLSVGINSYGLLGVVLSPLRYLQFDIKFYIVFGIHYGNVIYKEIEKNR